MEDEDSRWGEILGERSDPEEGTEESLWLSRKTGFRFTFARFEGEILLTLRSTPFGVWSEVRHRFFPCCSFGKSVLRTRFYPVSVSVSRRRRHWGRSRRTPVPDRGTTYACTGRRTVTPRRRDRESRVVSVHPPHLPPVIGTSPGTPFLRSPCSRYDCPGVYLLGHPLSVWSHDVPFRSGGRTYRVLGDDGRRGRLLRLSVVRRLARSAGGVWLVVVEVIENILWFFATREGMRRTSKWEISRRDTGSDSDSEDIGADRRDLRPPWVSTIMVASPVGPRVRPPFVKVTVNCPVSG